jgi:hypothetical protein
VIRAYAVYALPKLIWSSAFRFPREAGLESFHSTSPALQTRVGLASSHHPTSQRARRLYAQCQREASALRPNYRTVFVVAAGCPDCRRAVRAVHSHRLLASTQKAAKVCFLPWHGPVQFRHCAGYSMLHENSPSRCDSARTLSSNQFDCQHSQSMLLF